MEVGIDSPASHDSEDQGPILPGLDMLSGGQDQADSPMAAAVSPYSPSSSAEPEVGPATPGGGQSGDCIASPASDGAEQSPQDENSQQHLQRTPSSDENEKDDNGSHEAEEVANDITLDSGSVSMDLPANREETEEKGSDEEDSHQHYSAGHLPGLDMTDEAADSIDYVPGLDSGTGPPKKTMYAFLSSGQDEEEVEEEEEEKEEKEPGEGDEENGVSVQESIPFLGDSSIPSPEEVMESMEEHEVEAQVDVVEQVVETSEVQDTCVETTPHEEEEEVQVAQQPQEPEASEAVDTEAPRTPPRSPQQVVEEVFLTTGAKDQDSGDSDFEGFEAEKEAAPKDTTSRKRRARVIDDDDEEEEEEEGEESDFEGFEPEENKKGDRQGLIADIFDIFGHSDDEGEFEGFAETEVQPAGQEGASDAEEAAAKAGKASEQQEEKAEPSTGEDAEEKKKKKKDDASSSSSSEDEGVSDRQPLTHLSDFEAMMMRKKEESRRRRRRRGDIEVINNSDDIVVQLISDMKIAASQDRDLILQKMPAIQKLRMLPQVVGMLRKSDMQMALIDCGVLSAITEWLSPLPDRSLPALPIRRSLLQALSQLPGIGADSLKESGVGKAVMYLNKHPKEIPENKKTAGKLIYNWSRPIFDLTSDYKSLSKEERQKRDMEHLPKKRAISSTSDNIPKRDIDKEMSGDSRPLRPGDPGWVARARVPLPSNKDYVYRPRPKVESAMEEAPPKKVGRFEKHMRKIKEWKGKNSRIQKAVGMSLEGRKMAL